ncbi:MAG: phage holin family protein [Candidatus Promineifilaceae bacterium]
MNLIIRLVVNAIAVYAAAYFVSGVNLEGDLAGIAIVALVFGVINAFVKPIIKFFSFPLILLSMGLFTLVINAVLLMVTSLIVPNLSVNGFGPAFFGAIVISIVSWLLSAFVNDDEK